MCEVRSGSRPVLDRPGSLIDDKRAVSIRLDFQQADAR